MFKEFASFIFIRQIKDTFEIYMLFSSSSSIFLLDAQCTTQIIILTLMLDARSCMITPVENLLKTDTFLVVVL